MGKNGATKNELPLPPGGGMWRFCMVSGMVIPGEVLGIYNNSVVIQTPAGESVVLNKAQIESYWEGMGIQEEKKEGEDKA